MPSEAPFFVAIFTNDALTNGNVCSNMNISEGEQMYDICNTASLEEKLTVLSDAAKYDVACTSSGVSRAGKQGYLGNSASAGICHAFAADGRCISLLKILMTNNCIYDSNCLSKIL